MATIMHMQFHSHSIRKQTSVQIILPDDTKPPYRTLYLLHGWSDNETAWMRHTQIEQYAQEHQLAVIMPDVGLSYYTDMAYGGNYFTYVTEELPAHLERNLPLSTAAENRYVAGLSMGGFGSFKWAINAPERFRAAASFSGALLVDELLTLQLHAGDQTRKPYMQAILGPERTVHGTNGDLLPLLDELVAHKKQLPALFQYCGTEDFLHDINLQFRAHVESLGITYTYNESAGDHNWPYWDACIKNWLSTLKQQQLL